MTLAKYELIDAEKACHSIARMCAWLGVNRAGIDGGFIGWKGWSSCQVDLVRRTPPSVGIRRS
ncbi:hypothetical protein [Streptosporangium sp. G12]